MDEVMKTKARRLFVDERFLPVGPEDPAIGSPTQAGLLQKG